MTTTTTDCTTCENARRMFTPGGWIDCPACRPARFTSFDRNGRAVNMSVPSRS